MEEKLAKLPKNMFVDIIETHKYYLDYVTINWEIPYNSQNSFSKPSATHFIHTITKTIKSELQTISELHNYVNGIDVIADGIHKHIKVHFKGSFFVHNNPKLTKNKYIYSSTTNIIDDTKSIHNWFIIINDIIQQAYETYNISYLNCQKCKHCKQLNNNTYEIEHLEELDYEYIKHIRQDNKMRKLLFNGLPCKYSKKIYLIHHKAKPNPTISRIDIATHSIDTLGKYSFHKPIEQKYPKVVGKKNMHVQPSYNDNNGDITSITIGKMDKEGKHSRKSSIYLRVYDKGINPEPNLNFMNRFKINHYNVIRKEWELHRGAIKSKTINSHNVDNFFTLFKSKNHIRNVIRYIRINKDVLLEKDTPFYKSLHDSINKKIWSKDGMLKTTFKQYSRILKDKTPIILNKVPEYKWKGYNWNAFDYMIKPALLKKSTFDNLTNENIKFITDALNKAFDKQNNEYKILTDRDIKIKKELDKLEKINQLFPN
tara:strand:+ start:2944 stop:4395 length:1452 start_codon:yes stop_codon:yes gene_type:complete